MKPMAWHKHYHERALNGMKNLPVDLRGVYYTLLDLMYEHMHPLAESDQMMAARMCCSVRKWKSYRDQLIALGKIKFTDDGKLTNDRFEYELKMLRKRAENLSKAGRTSAESRKKAKENSETGQQVLQQEVNRVPECQSARVNEDDKSSSVDEQKTLRLIPEDITPIDEAVQYYIQAAERLARGNGGKSVWPVPRLPLNSTRRKHISARLKETDLLTWQEVVDKAATAGHTTGHNDRNWTADLDWLAKRENFDKVLEGKYKPLLSGTQPAQPDELPTPDHSTFKNWLAMAHTSGEWPIKNEPGPDDPNNRIPPDLLEWFHDLESQKRRVS